MTKNRQGFPPNRRLCRQADYRSVFSKPVRCSTRYFTILYTRNRKSHPRLGLAISKKIIRKAVDRNRIKRMIRESFRLNQQQLGYFDIVVLAKRASVKLLQGGVNKNQTGLWKELYKTTSSQ